MCIKYERIVNNSKTIIGIIVFSVIIAILKKLISTMLLLLDIDGKT